MNLLIKDQPATMSSLEIAKLTGKEHSKFIVTLVAVALIVLMSAFCFFQIAINAILKAVLDFFGISEEF